MFIAAGRGLAAAHAAGLVHRDFKPDNVLLDKDGRPRVVDFGLARQAGGGDDELAGETGDDRRRTEPRRCAIRAASTPLATLTKTGTGVGTPAYMAPEQFLGERGDARSDQFSFCVALYEALYGERPFAGDDCSASRSTSPPSSCARCPRIARSRPGSGARSARAQGRRRRSAGRRWRRSSRALEDDPASSAGGG